MKTTKILGCISIGILAIIMLDIYFLEGTAGHRLLSSVNRIDRPSAPDPE